MLAGAMAEAVAAAAQTLVARVDNSNDNRDSAGDDALASSPVVMAAAAAQMTLVHDGDGNRADNGALSLSAIPFLLIFDDKALQEHWG